MTLSGCITAAPSVNRSLPNAPAFAQAVPEPELIEGQDARLALAKHRAALRNANRNIINFNEWYESLKKTYRGEK